MFRLRVNVWVILLLFWSFSFSAHDGFGAKTDPSQTRKSKRKTAEIQRLFKQHVATAQVHFQAEEWPQAITAYLAAYELHPRSVLLFNVAQSYRRDGNPEQALRYYEEFMRTDPDNPLVPECEAQARAMRTQIEAARVAQEQKEAERLAQQRAAEAEKLAKDKRLLEQKVIEERRTTEALKKQPVYKKKWFWIVLGGAVVTAGAVGIIVWKTRPSELAFDEGPYTFTFPK